MGITNKKQASKFLGIPKRKVFGFKTFLNGDWGYKDKRRKRGYYHLYRNIHGNWVELTKDVKALDIFSCNNGDWEYSNEDGYWYLYNDNNKLIEKYEVYEWLHEPC